MLAFMADPIRLDPVTLRGLAHPLRVRILGLLREHGPANATSLAAMLGQSTGATSYHLRQLANYGFIVEDPESGKGGRERWWKSAHHGTLLDEQVASQAPQDTEAYMRAIAAQHTDRIDHWLNEAGSLPPQWRSSATLSDRRLSMTPAEAKELHDAIFELASRYRRDEPGAEGEKVYVQVQIMPFVSASPS
jgi:DNA-binding transcriptional ArsR family regulator